MEPTAKLAIEIIEVYNLEYGIGISGAVIAATAIQLNLVLITDNIKHFHFIEGIKVQKPKY